MDTECRRWLDRVESAAVRAIAMLDDLMLFAKAGDDTIRAEPVSLGDALNDVRDDLGAAAEGSGVLLQVQDASISVMAEEVGLRRLISNLVGNAIKYSPAGAQVHVTTDRIDGTVRVNVRDNGPGIPPEQLEKVMLPFRRLRTDKPGTGLGLSIAKRYAECYGGRLWLESDGKNGTTAVLELKESGHER
jgi:signal transduction histidine kinase